MIGRLAAGASPASRTVAATGGLALVVRLAAGVATAGLWQPQLYEYATIARNMLAGDGFTYQHLNVVYRSFGAPLHAWLTAASYWLTDSIVPVMLLQAVTGAGLAAIACAVASRLFDDWKAGALAGALVAVHPGLVLYAVTKAHPLTFDAFFFALALLLTYRLADKPTVSRAAQLGLAVGVGALSRATLVIVLPIAGLWLLAGTRRPSWPALIRVGVAAGLAAVAIIGPWTLRNSLVHDRFVFMVTTDQEAFWLGNNPNATGHLYVERGRTVLETLPRSQLQFIRDLDGEIAQSAWFARESAAFIREQPGAFLRLWALKFYRFWWFSPQNGVEYPPLWRSLYMAYYIPVLALAVVGAGALIRRRGIRREDVWLVCAFLLALSVLQSLYYVEGRHRWAVEPLLLVLSGGGAALLIPRGRAAQV